MAYHYRVIDQHRRSPSFSYWAEHAIPDFGRAYGHFQSPMDVHEALVREDEKERIRGGIIAEEIARFRMLDAELRRQGMGIPFNEPRVKPDANLSGVKRRAEMAAEAVISSNLPIRVPMNTADLVQNTQKTKELPMKKFKFWCDLCNVGAFAENVMNEHERGKKHTAMLREMKEH